MTNEVKKNLSRHIFVLYYPRLSDIRLASLKLRENKTTVLLSLIMTSLLKKTLSLFSKIWKLLKCHVSWAFSKTGNVIFWRLVKIKNLIEIMSLYYQLRTRKKLSFKISERTKCPGKSTSALPTRQKCHYIKIARLTLLMCKYFLDIDNLTLSTS